LICVDEACIIASVLLEKEERMANVVNPAIFRAYDIRGVVDVDLNGQILTTLGRATGTYFGNQGAHRLVIGRDARNSSPAFQHAFIEGLRSTGIHVIDIGEVPTPLMYFAIEHLHSDGGIIISASHNPPEYNGVKLRRSHPEFGSEPIPIPDIQAIGTLANSDGPFRTGPGGLSSVSVLDAYEQSVVALLRMPEEYQTPERRPRVVLDGGNGVAGPIAQRTLQAIGAEVIPLHIEPDGNFPNHHPDPSKRANLHDLTRAVVAHQADMGLALDGDGDRLGVVDSDGTIIWPDRYLIVLALYLLAQKPGPVVFDVMCSGVLPDAITDAGGTPVMCKTGYASVARTMREVDAILGGELSGHTFSTYPGHYYDDGTFTGAHLLRALCHLSTTNPPPTGRIRSLSSVLTPYPALPTLMEDRIRFTDNTKFQVIDHVRAHFADTYRIEDVDGVRIDFGDGWGLVRASNTEPFINTRFEAVNEERVLAIRDTMLQVVYAFRETLHVPS
jgi:phosphomannomutase